MIFWLLTGCMAAAVVGMVTEPIRQSHPRLSWVLTMAFPLLGLMFYALTGNPELAR